MRSDKEDQTSKLNSLFSFTPDSFWLFNIQQIVIHGFFFFIDLMKYVVMHVFVSPF